MQSKYIFGIMILLIVITNKDILKFEDIYLKPYPKPVYFMF